MTGNKHATVERSLPKLSYPPDLPITAERARIVEAIRANQVLIIAGATGSGKSTQLPKFCLEAGQGKTAMIGHTQPRRIAAKSVADRIASELEQPLGQTVGYQVRFNQTSSQATAIKVMTDGILLAEINRDPQLSSYDTVILDEAHERSLNIDFLIGYLRQLLPKRPDLKLIITSATIDTAQFAKHFDAAPVISVEGRSYPVEIRFVNEARSDSVTEAADAALGLLRENPGDVLVFCSGDREINEVTAALEAKKIPQLEVLQLAARLSDRQQKRIFQDHTTRRIIVSTNVAETSLTVPGVTSVVDLGTARISRYNSRTKVQRLPIEPISQSAAAQRAGRCGRLAPGICVRIYSEEDFLARPYATEPEIQRTNLASVILTMLSRSLGDIKNFPFIDAPDDRSISAGFALLEEIEAIKYRPKAKAFEITKLGRSISRLPIDPRLARSVIAASDQGCLPQMLIIASALSIQDPRLRPLGSEKLADAAHATHGDGKSDLSSILELWHNLKEKQSELTSSAFKRFCEANFIHHQRYREWIDIHRQLLRSTKKLSATTGNDSEISERLSRSLLTGFLSQIGKYVPEKKQYKGARGLVFNISPGSVISRSENPWVMACELSETNKTWARQVAPIKPEWLEELGRNFLKSSFVDAWWDSGSAKAMTMESKTLFGLEVVSRRVVPLKIHDASEARAWFIQHALIEGDWFDRYPFRDHNKEIAEQAKALEAQQRASTILWSDSQLHDFFDLHLGKEVYSAADFSTWWREIRVTQAGLLNLSLSDVADVSYADELAFPALWRYGEMSFNLVYEYSPGSASDGMIIEIPLSAIKRIDTSAFEWLVPGYRQQLFHEILKKIPKQTRRKLGPLSDLAKLLKDELEPTDTDVVESVKDAVRKLYGIEIPDVDGHRSAIPSYLRPVYRILDSSHSVISEGRELSEILGVLETRFAEELKATTHPIEQVDLSEFPVNGIPGKIKVSEQSTAEWAFPSLTTDGTSVSLRLLPNRTDQSANMWRATVALLNKFVPSEARQLRPLITSHLQLAIQQCGYESTAQWYHDNATALMDNLISGLGGPAWTYDAWTDLRSVVLSEFPKQILEVCNASAALLTASTSIRKRLRIDPTTCGHIAEVDINKQLDGLIYPGFVQAMHTERLPDVARYMQAITIRIDQLGSKPARDNRLIVKCRSIEKDYEILANRYPASEEITELAWTLQELRVALFAQQTGAVGSPSEKKIQEKLGQIIREGPQR